MRSIFVGLLVTLALAATVSAQSTNIPAYSTAIACKSNGPIFEFDLYYNKELAELVAIYLGSDLAAKTTAGATLGTKSPAIQAKLAKELAWLAEVKGAIYGLQNYYLHGPQDFIFAAVSGGPGQPGSLQDYFLKLHTLGLLEDSLSLITQIEGKLRNGADALVLAPANLDSSNPVNSFAEIIVQWPALRAQILAITSAPLVTRKLINPLTGAPLTNPPGANQMALFGLGSAPFLSGLAAYSQGNITAAGQGIDLIFMIRPIVVSLAESTMQATALQDDLLDRPRRFNDKIAQDGYCPSSYYSGVVARLGAANGDEVYSQQKSNYNDLADKMASFKGDGWTAATVLKALKFYYGPNLDGKAGFMYERLTGIGTNKKGILPLQNIRYNSLL